jgi:hypothetical protein
MRRSVTRGIVLVAAIAAAMPAQAQSVDPAPDTGTAIAGIAATPIINVAANDTVNGAPATLGASGNATIAQGATWSAGIVRDPASGTVSTTASVPSGVYDLPYQLCDLNVPPDCALTTDTVTLTASIVAVPDSGSADAGIASKPIVNVAANDTVNGAQATLGAPGNATVSKVGIWPTGIALVPSTGAVTTSTAVPAGTYSLPYRLCDKNQPPDCVTTTDSIVVVVASIVAVPDSGSAYVGVASKPIANVAANDTVNGAPATLGTSGNATVARNGAWPTGIALAPSTGAVSTTAAVPAGMYSLPYRVCDRNTPASCATTTDTVAVTPPAFTEVQASTGSFVDIEFDWGRDGVYCATCSFGQSNARFNWTDQNGNLWVGHVDPNTGAFTPTTGNNELADTSAFYPAFGNGPEWAFSTQDGQVISQLVYARHPPGTPAVTANAGAAFATPIVTGWTANFFPGTEPTGSGGTLTTVNPLASQCNTDSIALTYFYGIGTSQDVYWEPTTTDPGTAPTLTPFGSDISHISGGKPSIRWVPCTHQMVFVGTAPPDDSGNVYQQVFWYNTDTQVEQQLTFDPNEHAEAFMFQAPEFGDAYVLVTISNDVEIDVYEQTGVDDSGAPTFQLVNQITSSDPAEPYIAGTEPFINCAPTCQSYIFMRLQSLASYQSNSAHAASGVAVTNIDPAQPLFKILAPQAATPTIQRIDLEYYITANGPYLYYDRNTVTSPTTRFEWGNRYYIDMQLGAPSGPCVGSSAEGGMLPGC